MLTEFLPSFNGFFPFVEGGAFQKAKNFVHVGISFFKMPHFFFSCDITL
jgi:hypothetical protein